MENQREEKENLALIFIYKPYFNCSYFLQDVRTVEVRYGRIQP